MASLIKVISFAAIIWYLVKIIPKCFEKMKALAQIKNLNCDEEKRMVIRNLSRIMDIRIIDIDLENGKLFFGYSTPFTLSKIKEELSRIGHPVESCNPFSSNQPGASGNYNANSTVFV